MTGTLYLRGRFPNPKRILSPGLFARIRLPIGKPHASLAIPEKALGTDQGQKYVYVVDDKNKVDYRPVKVGQCVAGRVARGRGRAQGRRASGRRRPATGQAGKHGRAEAGRGDLAPMRPNGPRPKPEAAVAESRGPARQPVGFAGPAGAGSRQPLPAATKAEAAAATGRLRERPGLSPKASTMFSRFFIDRPIFATVLSIVITLGGGLAVFNLPLAQYPPVTPPIVRVYCGYPGASAQVVAETVAAPIEQQVNGVENMLYMESPCANDGSYSLAVTFKHGVNLNLAQVLVQNRVNLALPQLPDVLKQTGVTTRKQSPDMVMSVNINSPHGRYDQLYLSNYALKYIRDELLRLPGVSDMFITRPARLRHADLGRSGEAGRAEPHGRRRGQRHSRAKRAGGLRARSGSRRPSRGK